MEAKILVMDCKQENVLLFCNRNSLNIIGGSVYAKEMPFVAVKRILEKELNLMPEQFDIHFIRHENVVKSDAVATDDYVVLVVLREDLVEPDGYIWVPITDERIIYNTEGCGKIYTYLREGINLLCK